MGKAPFRVEMCRQNHPGRPWVLRQRRGDKYVFMECCPSMGAAIDHAYKNWPWWP